MGRLAAALDRLGRAFAHVAAVALLAMTAAVTYGVVMRYAFNSAQNWTDELATYCLAAIAFLGLAHTLRSDGHIRIDLITGRLPPRPRRTFEFAAHLIGLGFAVLLLLGCVDVAANFMKRGTQSISGLRVPLFWPSLVLVAGSAVFLVAMAARTIACARELARAATTPDDGAPR